jgi:hypothetical protein
MTGPAVLGPREERELAGLDRAFGDEHDLGVRDGTWWARRADGSDASFSASTAAELGAAIRLGLADRDRP